jgi:outer membrane autotransporter protein
MDQGGAWPMGLGRLLTSTAMLGALAVGYSRRAYAACSPTGPGTYTCSGAITTSQVLGGHPLTVTTTPGLSINTGAGGFYGGAALALTAVGSLSFDDPNASTIIGGDDGIDATLNFKPNLSPGGDLTITATGPVKGVTGRGIFAQSLYYGRSLAVKTGYVYGKYGGILASNGGSGDTSIIATKAVVAKADDGIFAHEYHGALTIAVESVSTGAGGGIDASNFGSKPLTITATGKISAKSGEYPYQVEDGVGITAGSSGGLTITTNSVYGQRIGISAGNIGPGDLSITSSEEVAAKEGPAIEATNWIYGRSLTIAAQNVTSKEGSGIVAYNSGSGPLTITTSGKVNAGGDFGIHAVSYAGDLSVSSKGVFAEGDAIRASVYRGHFSTATPQAISVTAAGLTDGASGSGIRVINRGPTGSSTSITVTSTGTVRGLAAGVNASSRYGAPIAITNNGTIENISALSTDPAIVTTGGKAGVVNNGVVTGDIKLSGPYANNLTNNGTWNSAGAAADFGGAGTIINSTTGTIYAGAASGASAPVTTSFNNIATFNNAGLLSAHNGVVGDRIIIGGDFAGNGGGVALDTVFGADGSKTDKLIVNGNASGTTNLFIYNAGGLGAFTPGIEVVQVGGTSTAGAFQLGQMIAAGAFSYNLAEGAGGWFLQSTLTPPTPPNPSAPLAPVLPSYRTEVPVYLAMPELANMLGFAMIDNYDARMGGGPRLGFTGQPDSQLTMAPPPCSSLTPAEAKKAMQAGRGCATPAVEAKLTLEQLPLGWGRVFGVTGEQRPGGRPSQSLSTPFLNGQGPQFSASYGGFQVGADLLGASLYGGFDKAGLYFGYANAFANVDQVYSSAKAGSVTLNAYSGGAYWTHVAPQGWWLDGVAQATWFEDAKGSTLNTGMSVSGSALTFSLESGYPLRPYPNWTVEPQGQLIFQYAQMGPGADAFGVTSFGDTNDFRGRIGVKASYVAQDLVGGLSPAAFWGRINLWHDFLASPPSATFATLTGTFPTTIDGTLGQTFGEVDLGVDAHLTQTVSLFGFCFYDHSVDSGSSWSAGGKAGVKIQF